MNDKNQATINMILGDLERGCPHKVPITERWNIRNLEFIHANCIKFRADIWGCSFVIYANYNCIFNFYELRIYSGDGLIKIDYPKPINLFFTIQQETFTRREENQC